MTNGQTTIVYGLTTCDTCKKARRALESAGRRVAFRDIRMEPLDANDHARFLAVFGEKLVNRASTTWRGLGEAARQATPQRLLSDHPALMKRPVIERGGMLWLGWDAKVQTDVLK